MLARLTIMIFYLMALACQKKTSNDPKLIDPRIKEKAELYKSLSRGWSHDKCDSLGFTALAKIAGGAQDADIYQAEGEPGRWYRSPEHDCYDLGESKSDISKDMFTMLFPYLYLKGDRQNLQEIYDYGKENGWIMGRGYISRTLMTPAMIWTLQRMLNLNYQVNPNSSEKTAKAGFEKHLDAISLFTKALIGDGLDPIQYEQIRKYSEENPKNALFVALYRKYRDGNQAQAIEILLDESLFPSDRLPTSADRCEEYLWQRDDGADWQPCDQGKVHDGTDFLFAAYVAGQI